MSLRLLELLGVIVIFQLLFIAFFLFTHPKGKRLSNGLLGSFFGAVALNMFDGLYVLTGWADANPHLAFIGGSGSFLFGPLLYFYTQSVVYRDYRLPRTAVLHALPFLLVTGLTVVVYHMQPLPVKLLSWRRGSGTTTRGWSLRCPLPGTPRSWPTLCWPCAPCGGTGRPSGNGFPGPTR